MKKYKSNFRSKIINEVIDFNDRLAMKRESPADTEHKLRQRDLAAQLYIDKRTPVKGEAEGDTRSRFTRAVEAIKGLNPVSGIEKTPFGQDVKTFFRVREPNVQQPPSIYKRKEGLKVGTTEPSDFEKTIATSKTEPTFFNVAGYTPAGRVAKLVGQKLASAAGTVTTALGSATEKGIELADKAADAATKKGIDIGSRGLDIGMKGAELGYKGAKMGAKGAWWLTKKTGGLIKDIAADEWAKSSSQSDQAFLRDLSVHEENLHKEHASRLGMSYGDYRAIFRDAPDTPPVPVSASSPNYREELKEYENQKRAWNAHVELHRQIHGLHRADSDLAAKAREIESHKKRMMDSLDARTGGSWRSYSPPLWASNSHSEIDRHFVP